MDPRIKQIKIKTGVLKRIAKEKVVYVKEADQQRVRIQKYKDDGKDEYDVRKQEEILQECLMMIPECEKRVVKAFSDLKELVDNETELSGTEEYKLAQTVLVETGPTLPSGDQQYC